MNRRAAAFLSAALLFAPSFANAAGQNPAETSAVSIPPQRIERAVAALDRIVASYQRRTGVPGIAVAVVRDDRVVYIKGFGVREAGTNKKVDANTVFQLASVSKPVGATVIAGLVGRGVVKWSDPVVKHLPAFKLADPWVTDHVTIADMYSHRSGLPDHAGDLLEDLGYDRATILQRLALEPLDPFRITYAYTNFGITAAAQSAANAAGASWEDVSRDVLYRPLGMNSTSSRFVDFEKSPDRALTHVRFGKSWVARYVRQPDPESPAGGVSSSVSDMAKWLRLELAQGKFNGKQIVDAKALLETRIPQMVSGRPTSPTARSGFYGLGMNVSYDEAGRVRLGHSGAFALGAGTAIGMLPSEHLGIVVLTNGMPIGVPESIIADFFDLAEMGKIERDWFAAYTPLFAQLFVNPSALAGKQPPANAAPALAETAYAGTYHSGFYGDMTIAARSGRLVMVLGPRHEEFPLAHWTGNTFAYMPRGENALGISAVTFAVANGQATSVVVENLNQEKLGTFSRIQSVP
jgi:CubicO group peptidase (beta-lactamase class C family)